MLSMPMASCPCAYFRAHSLLIISRVAYLASPATRSQHLTPAPQECDIRESHRSAGLRAARRSHQHSRRRPLDPKTQMHVSYMPFLSTDSEYCPTEGGASGQPLLLLLHESMLVQCCAQNLHNAAAACIFAGVARQQPPCRAALSLQGACHLHSKAGQAWAHGAGLIVLQVAQMNTAVKGGNRRNPVLVGGAPAQRINVPLAVQHQERLHGAVQPGAYSKRLSGR